MAKTRDVVHVALHKDYFNNIFEPQRRQFAKKIGLPDISQVKFTQYLAKNNAPKLDMSLFPKRKMRFRI